MNRFVRWLVGHISLSLSRLAHVLAIVVALSACTSTFAQCEDVGVRYVRPGGSDAATGYCWDSAFKTLGRALVDVNTLEGVGEIHLAGWNDLLDVPGVIYRVSDFDTDPGTPGVQFEANGSFVIEESVIIRGGFKGVEEGGDEPTDRDECIWTTTLSGDIGDDDDEEEFDDNSWHVIKIPFGVEANIDFDGLTITAGHAIGEEDYDDRRGGAIDSEGSVEDSRIRLRNCVLHHNRATRGGAICSDSQLFCRGCRFESNTAIPTPDGLTVLEGSWGGAIASVTWLEVVHCHFEANEAQGVGLGGAVFVDHGTEAGEEQLPFMFTNSVFIGNKASKPEFVYQSQGGAIHSAHRTQLTVTGSLFHSNYASEGGAICCGTSSWPAHLWLLSSTIANNSAKDSGGLEAQNLTIANSIIVGNTASNGDTFCGGHDGDLCAQIGTQISSLMTINHSCITGIGTDTETAGGDNIEADPEDLFEDPNGGDFRLAAGSPAVDVGDNSLVPLDVTDANDDSVESGALPWDARRNVRIVGCGPIVDMGAFEFWRCEGDANADGIVDGADITTVLGFWGCSTPPCGGDVDCSGSTGGGDITLILGNWENVCDGLPVAFCAEGSGTEEMSMMSSGGEGVTPEALLEVWGFEDLSDFVEWIESLDFNLMEAILSALEGA